MINARLVEPRFPPILGSESNCSPGFFVPSGSREEAEDGGRVMGAPLLFEIGWMCVCGWVASEN